MKRIATTLLVASLMATPMLALPPSANARVSIGIGVSVGIPPPVLPVYAQPMIPGPGYIWTPGYWAWDSGYSGYYWVPGTWVMPPQIGLLWTPGWWGWSEGFYRWHGGYWGSHVGFYGGVNYGFGYFGAGYRGGYWRGGHFFYNRAVNNINATRIRNVYVDRTVINNVHNNRVSYNGGHGGIAAQPSSAERGWANQHRYSPTTMQTHQRSTAMRNPAQRFSANQGKPAVFATRQAGRFDGPHAVRTAGDAANPDRGQRNDGFVHAPRNGSPRAAQVGSPSRDAMMASGEHSTRAHRGNNGQWSPQSAVEPRHASQQAQGERREGRNQEQKQARKQEGKQERGDGRKHNGHP